MSVAGQPTLTDRVWAELTRIPDPEIPAISLVDLGVIGSVHATPHRIRVELLPTFLGCPAIGVMVTEIRDRLTATRLARDVEVAVTYDPPWTSDRISAEGRERLRMSGFAPPAPVPQGAALGMLDELAVLPTAVCPFCGLANSTLDNPFGPTLCRAIYHCEACNQPFEQFKRV